MVELLQLLDDPAVASAIAAVAILVIAAGLLHSPTRCRWWASYTRTEDEGHRERIAVTVLEDARLRGFARARGLRVTTRGPVGGWLIESRDLEPVVCRTDFEALDEIGRRLRLPGGDR